MNWTNWVKIFFAALGGALSWLFGGLDMFVAAVAVLMVIDYITGCIAAGITKQLSSKVGAKGALKKVLILMVIVMAALLDYLLKTYTDLQIAVCLGIACFYYAGNECLSILENLGRAGVPYPEKLKDIILQLNQKESPDTNIIESVLHETKPTPPAMPATADTDAPIQKGE
jgi:toxin secretion/phage lysis holin